MKMIVRICLISLAMLLSYVTSFAKEHVAYSASVEGSVGTGAFAPFYMASNRYGILSSARNIITTGMIKKNLQLENRFSYGFGGKLSAGISNGVSYERFESTQQRWDSHKMFPSNFQIVELYGEVKWRGVYITAGQKEHISLLLNNRLSSGDMTRSINAMPIPGFGGGFVDFQDIPLTRGWLQIEGELSYGKFMDSNWWKNHSDYYNSKLTRGVLYMYRRLYFRTNPAQPLVATFGVQSGAQFGGETDYYFKGEMVKTDKRGLKFSDFFKIQIPFIGRKAEDFAMGNSLGSWDIRLDYSLKSQDVISLYAELPWEDGSGMAKCNGWDGLYGVEYRSSNPHSWLRGVVVEYLDLVNQSGPIHWAPGDHPGTGLTGEATGADDYYNNAYYMPWANFGFGMGNSLVMSPIYNQDGYMMFIGNRMRGFHLGAEGRINSYTGWILKMNYRKAYGNGYAPLLPARESWSLYGGCVYIPKRLKGMEISINASIDRGKLPGNSVAIEASLTYSGNFSYGK